MHKLRSLLSSANCLFTFEAAARHQSFTGAALELNISQPAVSKSIQQLEDDLGVRLFHRRHRGIELSGEGRRFFGEVASALDHLYATGLALQREPVKEVLEVSCSSLFAVSWLLPRIESFRAEHPNLTLHVRISQRDDENLAREGIDLSLRLGDGTWSGLRTWRFADEEVYPVCSPAYLERHGPIGSVGELPRHRLLHLDERYRIRIGWKEWLHQNGVESARLAYDIVFTDAQVVIEATAAGQGIALTWNHLIRDLLVDGRLIRPVPNSYRSGLGIFIVAPDAGPMKWGARVLRDWLLAHAGEVRAEKGPA